MKVEVDHDDRRTTAAWRQRQETVTVAAMERVSGSRRAIVSTAASSGGCRGCGVHDGSGRIPQVERALGGGVADGCAC